MGAQQSNLAHRSVAPGSTSSAEKLAGQLKTMSLEREHRHRQNDADLEKLAHRKRSREAEGLPLQVTRQWQESALQDPKNRLAIAALSTNNPRSVLLSTPRRLADAHVFNTRIPFEGAPVTNQNASGRCWLFASTNTFRIGLMQRYGLDSFELSQGYLFFWDKFEKANWFLEQMLATAGEALDSRLVQTMLAEPLSDGGQWDMVANLVAKYGVVPQSLYPDAWSARDSRVLNTVLKTKLREHGLRLRAMSADEAVSADDVSRAKARMVEEIHLILMVALGPPPRPDEEFTWDFLDKSGAARSVTSTPLAFAGEIHGARSRLSTTSVPIPRIDAMLSLVHDPRHVPLTHLTVARLGNVVGGRGVHYVNVDMATIKSACVAMLRAGLPVFFGSDVGQFEDTRTGVMDLDLYGYELGFNVSLRGLGKADRLRAGESQMTHAMVLTAVHIGDDGKPVRWRVMNSWGADVGDKGYFVMTDSWMDEFVYQAVVDPRYVAKEVSDVLKKDPVVLPLWDPMGSLA